MANMAKNKGANGEREALKWFMERFPDLGNLYRNLEQTRSGGADCLCIDGIALEVKRQESLSIPSWWIQTKNQARRTSRLPILMYRQNRKKWVFCIPSYLLIPYSIGYLSLTEEEFHKWFALYLSYK